MEELSTQYELMETSQYDYLMKVVLVGDEAVGKTTFFKEFLNQPIPNNYSPTSGVDVDFRVVNLKEKTVHIQIWDTTSLERYRNITRSYYRGANIIIIFYDITSYKSFQNVINWMKSIFEVKPSKKAYTLALLGTRRDISTKRAVPYLTAYNFAMNHGLYFKEVCLASSINKHTQYDINNIFEDLIWRDIEKKGNENIHYELIQLMSGEKLPPRNLIYDVRNTEVVDTSSVDSDDMSKIKCCFIC